MPPQPNLKPLSIYRGQAKSGIGEGPSIPVAHGEQYLEGTADAFRDDELLRELRPWMTLDSDSADHQRLQDRLEGWSCFSTAGKLFVVRLASAGIYDRRAAYFSHARAWPLERCLEAADPGVYLGCSDLFDASEERKGESDTGLDKLSPDAMPQRWLPQLQANTAAATAFLGHLLQAVERGYPLLIAAPVTAFTPGSDLFVLVAFARAALPADLKPRCTIRLYTRQPERFARHLEAKLILLPEDSAAEAMVAQGQATLLDPQGKLLKTANPLEPAAQAYAQVAVAGALKAPQGLLPFSAYLGRQRARGLRAGADVALLQLSYLLAMGLAGDEADRAEVFRYVMRAQGPGLPWEMLLDDGDWARFPPSVLAEFVLAPADTLKSQGELELQGIVASSMDRLGLTLDDALEGWWQANDSRKLGRLAELLSQPAKLFGSQAAVAEKTLRVPLGQWRQAASALHGLLKLEMQAGKLGLRSGEREALAELAKDPDGYAVLAAATAAGPLDTGWAEQFIRQARPEDAGILTRMALDWLKSPADLAKGLPLRLVDCLRRLRIPIPANLAERIAALGQSLDLSKDLDAYLRLAELLNPLAPDKATTDNPLMDALNPAKLLDCLREAGPRLDKAHVRWVYTQLTGHWRQDPGKTTAALIPAGAWLGWRREAGSALAAQERRLAALAWLSCLAWHDGTVPEATLESWKQAIEDLAPALSGAEMQRLRLGKDRQGGVSWPWISRFQEEQLADIARLATDLGVMAEFAEAVCKSSHYTGNPVDPIRAAFAAFQSAYGQDMPKGFSADALLWLMNPTPPQAKPLDLASSFYLANHAGHRQSQAYKARIRSVLAAFDTQPRQALEAMEDPNLWQERLFIDPWAAWLGSQQASEDFLTHLEHFLRSSPKQLPHLFSTGHITAAERLRKNGFKEIARCLNPELRSSPKPPVSHASTKTQTLPGLPGVVLDALLGMRSGDTVWRDIALSVYPQDGHPLIELVQYDDILHLFRQTRRDNTLQEALSKNPGLLKPFSAPTPRLPAFELYACLHGDGNIATAITAFVRYVYNHHSTFQQDQQWWLALLESIENRCRNQPSNNPEAALASLCRVANNNVEGKTDSEKRRLSLQINQSLYNALVVKGHKDKARSLISE